MRKLFFLFICLLSLKAFSQQSEIRVDLAEGKKTFDFEFSAKEFESISKLIIENSKYGIHKWQVTITEKKKTKVEKEPGNNSYEVPITHQKHLKKNGLMKFELFYLNQKTKLEIVFCTVNIRLK